MMKPNRWISLGVLFLVGASGYGLYSAFSDDANNISNNPRLPVFNTLFATEFLEPTPVIGEKEEEIEETELITTVETEDTYQVLNTFTTDKEVSTKAQQITQEKPKVIVDHPVTNSKVLSNEIVREEKPRFSVAKDEKSTVVVQSTEDVLASSVEDDDEPFPNLEDASASDPGVVDMNDGPAETTQVTKVEEGEDAEFVQGLWTNSVAIKWRDKLILAPSSDPVWDKKLERAKKRLKERDILAFGWPRWRQYKGITRQEIIDTCRDAVSRTPLGTWWSFRRKGFWDLMWYFCSKPGQKKPSNWWYGNV